MKEAKPAAPRNNNDRSLKVSHGGSAKEARSSGKEVEELEEGKDSESIYNLQMFDAQTLSVTLWLVASRMEMEPRQAQGPHGTVTRTRTIPPYQSMPSMSNRDTSAAAPPNFNPTPHTHREP